MEKKIVKDDLKIEKACQSDWESVLQILKETGLKTYFSGNEHYNTFYIVKELETKQIICCFSIDYEDTVGILKSFAIEKNLHGKGLGKKVVNKIPEIAKRIGLKKLYATSWEAPDFWRKTDLKEITTSNSTDNYFLKYAKDLEINFPQYTNLRKHFVLVI